MISFPVLALIATVILTIVGAFVFYKKDKLEKELKQRTLKDLTKEERYGSHPSNYARLDVERYGRWKVEFSNGEFATRMGQLSTSLHDQKDSHSQVVNYREL